jgi:hypothetical protein
MISHVRAISWSNVVVRAERVLFAAIGAHF